MNNKQLEKLMNEYEKRVDVIMNLTLSHKSTYKTYADGIPAINESKATVINTIFGLYYYDLIDSDYYDALIDKAEQIANSNIKYLEMLEDRKKG